MKEKLHFFDQMFTEVHYQMANNTKIEGTSYFYNPDTIIKIEPITVINRLEYLMGKKRFEEAIVLV